MADNENQVIYQKIQQTDLVLMACTQYFPPSFKSAACVCLRKNLSGLSMPAGIKIAGIRFGPKLIEDAKYTLEGDTDTKNVSRTHLIYYVFFLIH